MPEGSSMHSQLIDPLLGCIRQLRQDVNNAYADYGRRGRLI